MAIDNSSQDAVADAGSDSQKHIHSSAILENWDITGVSRGHPSIGNDLSLEHDRENVRFIEG